MRTGKYFIAVLLLMLLPVICSAQQVLVWDFDDYYTIPNPDLGGEYGVEEGVVNALDANGITPVVVRELPEDISGYDAVFVVLGIWCYS